jgi:hypothetical protein
MRLGLLLALALVVGVGGAASDGSAARGRAAGTLNLRAVLDTTMPYRVDYCPPGSVEARPTMQCFKRDGRGYVPGLGLVKSSYIHAHVNERCPYPDIVVLGADVKLTIEGKGTIDIEIYEIPECLVEAMLTRPSRPFTITGGSGIYAGASGGGMLKQVNTLLPDLTAVGTDTWTGTLEVSGLEFDVVAPTFGGVAPRTVRVRKGVKNARVTFSVTATDAVDGPVPVACKPGSGARFRLGKTRVTCVARDSSGNTATARFLVTVAVRR